MIFYCSAAAHTSSFASWLVRVDIRVTFTLKSDMLQTIQILDVSPMEDDYIHTQKTVLCLVVAFNQKRTGEA